MDKRSGRMGWLVVLALIFGVIWIFFVTLKDGQRLLHISDKHKEPTPYHSKK